MEVRVLGPLEVREAARSVDVGGPRQRALLARLVVDANHAVSVEALLDELWVGRPPTGAKEALQSRVSRLRRSLGGDGRLVARGPGYVLRLDADELDASRFESLVRQARDAAGLGEAELVADLLGEAEGCWRGSALGEFPDDPVVHAEGRRLDQLRIASAEERFAAELAIGHHAQVVGDLEALVGLHPLRERLWGHLIVAFYRCGRQADALRAYGQLRHILAEELGIEPSAELVDLEEAVLLQKPELDWRPRDVRDEPQSVSTGTHASGRRPGPGNLPTPSTSFVGRVQELSRVSLLLDGARLLTLTGPGGVGKTRLALELASRAETCPEGAWVVELASLASPDLVPQAVASALGVSEQAGRTVTESLVEWLRSRRVLVVMDNCEHLVDACAGLAEVLLRACPGLRLLATSRQPLRVPAETIWALAPLEGPEHGASGGPAVVLDNDAARLLVERARAVRPRLELDDTEIDAIVELCARLEGIPLAIELAAARASVLSFEQLRSRLDGRLQICATTSLTSAARHRSVQATLDWSYDLLSGSEQTLLRGLSVFAGGFTLEAVEEMWDGEADGPQLLDLLGSLVDKSLVGVDHRRGPRYRLLQVVRQYAADKLDETEEAQLRDRHCDLHLRWAERAEPLAFGADPAPVLERVEIEHDNFRAALAWSLDAAPGDDRGLRLAHALHMLWIREHISEGRRWLEAFLTRDSHNLGLRSDVSRRAGILANVSDDHAAATALTTQAVTLAREAGDTARLARATSSAAALAVIQGHVDSERALLEESLCLARECVATSAPPQPFVLSQCLWHAAESEFRHGRYDDARRAAQDSLAAAPGDWLAESNALILMARIHREQGDFVTAALHLERCFAVRGNVGDVGTAVVVNELGVLAWERDDLPAARSHYAHARELSRSQENHFTIPLTLAGQAELAAAVNDLQAAVELVEAAAVLARRSIDISVTASVLNRVGDIRAVAGHIDLADAAYMEALALSDRAEMPWHQAAALEGLAFVRLAGDRPEDAARLLGAAAARREGIGAQPPRSVLPSIGDRCRAASAVLGPACFETCHRAGREARGAALRPSITTS